MYCCNSKTPVVQTEITKEGVKRRRKCSVCNKLIYTLEKEVPAPIKRPVPLPDERGLYKKPDAVALKMRKVENRRNNEDRVPSYFIEDDYD
jgi:transcriptional regulator NrdR family protein